VVGQEFVGKVPVPVIVFLLFVIVAFIILRYFAVMAAGSTRSAATRRPRASPTEYELVDHQRLRDQRLLRWRGRVPADGACSIRPSRSPARGPSCRSSRGGDRGTSLFGGEGTVIGTFIGALLIGVLNNGL